MSVSILVTTSYAVDVRSEARKVTVSDHVRECDRENIRLTMTQVEKYDHVKVSIRNVP